MVSSSRRSLLKLGAAASAYGLVPRKVRGWLGRQPTSARQAGRGAPLADPLRTHGYEEGVDQQPVGTVDGVVSVLGRPIYSAGDAVHGSMGWRALAATGGAALVYANPNAVQSSGSVYITPRSVGKSPAPVVSLLTASGVPVAQIRFRSDARADLVDSNGTRLDISGSCWLPDHTTRVDWCQVTTDSSTTVTVWIYVGLNIEAWRADFTLKGTLPPASISRVSIGPSTDKTVLGFDTYREYDCATVPAPYQPPVGVAKVHTFDEGTDGAPVIAGTDLITSVSGGPTYSSAMPLHGPLNVMIPSAAPGGMLTYDVPYPPAHTGSLYVVTTLRGTQDNRIVTLRNGSTSVAQINMRPSGSVCIKDAAGKVRAETRSKAKLADWTRIDWQASWDGSTLTFTVRYLASEPDTDGDSSEISAALDCQTIPDTLAIGNASGSWEVHLDTLRTYGDVSAWPPPFDPQPVNVFSLLGDPKPDGVTVSSLVLNLQQANLSVSASADMSHPVLAGSSPVDSDHLVRHRVSGLKPGTRYYAKLTTPDQTMFGDQLSFTTLPAPSGPMATMRIALTSCQKSSSDQESDEPGWQQMLDWDPHLVVHGGDFGYWGINLVPSDPYQKHLDFYRSQLEKLPVMRSLLMTRPSVIQVSDHETSADNGDNYNDPITATALVAFQKLMPTALYGDTRQPIRGRFLAFNLNARIRLISIDFRSLDRSPGAQPDGPTKTALGDVQMQWLTAELTRPEPLKIIASDPAWGPAKPPGKSIPAGVLDKWWNYSTTQHAIADIIQKTKTTTGGPINVDFWGNDRHLLGYLSGPHNTVGGFPVLCGSGIDQHALPKFAGELYDQVFGWGDSSIPRSQYMRIELTDDGAHTITRTATAWDCVTNSAQFSAVDTWTY